MKNELFERELQNTSINNVSLADYVKENYLPISILEKIRAEIDRQYKWLLQAGYTAYNVDIAFDTIKAVIAESEEL